MPAERFYLKNSVFIQDAVITMQDDEFHHLSHVMRLKEGETVELINGLGELAEASIESIEKKKATLCVLSIYKEHPPSSKLFLAQALPRMPRLEYILEKSVELGVTDLWLFPGDLSEKKDLSPSNLDRIHHIIVSAMKQCGRLFIPTLTILPPLLKWEAAKLPPHCFFGDTNPLAPPFYSLLESPPVKNSILIAIGPEKGFQEKELLFMKNSLSMQGVKLHQNILRTDTAAIASLALASTVLY